MMRLYMADSCPFAQRTRALLMHLGIDCDQRVVDLSNRDPEFLKLTPTGKVPLLIDGQLKLYESQVINDYLAEKHAFADGYSSDLATRAREKLAMAMWDQAVGTVFYRGLRDPDSFDGDARKALTAQLQELLVTIHATKKAVGNLLSFHVAPFWARMKWMSDHSPVAGAVDEWIDLRTWLEQTVAQDAVQRTLPDREATVARYLEVFVNKAAT